jgi:hypothetical protein
MVFSVLVHMDSVNAMVAYRPVEQAYVNVHIVRERTPAQQADMPP